MKRFLIIGLAMAVATGAAWAQGTMDLVVGEKTLVQRCVLARSPSKRMIAVGMPGGFNYAFDAQHCAPAFAWSGGFLDYKGEITGRGGKGSKILGVELPLGVDEVPLRVGNGTAMPESIRFRGYRRGGERGDPTFLFEVDGIAVEQRVHAWKGGRMSIAMAFPGGEEVDRFFRIDPTPHLQIKLSEGLKWSGPKVVKIPSGVTEAVLTIRLKVSDESFVREVEELTGEEVFQNFCSACHSIDGTKLIGPTFQGIWGREETVLREGKPETIHVDEEYFRESILKPQAAIVKGYELVPMADFSAVLTGEQIEDLMEYLKELE